MKANIETVEPVIRPGATSVTSSTLVRSASRTGFRPVRVAVPLFHAWRA